jgi:hypothetical protein
MTPIFLKQSVEELLFEAQKLVSEAKNFLINEGNIIEFDKYLTIKNYCTKYDIKDESVVTNWIRRGIIQPIDIHTFTELNGLRMIKDKIYK